MSREDHSSSGRPYEAPSPRTESMKELQTVISFLDQEFERETDQEKRAELQARIAQLKDEHAKLAFAALRPAKLR